MNYLQQAIDYFTDPNGFGFSILIAAGLGLILYLMKQATRPKRPKPVKPARKEDKYRLPYKPF